MVVGECAVGDRRIDSPTAVNWIAVSMQAQPIESLAAVGNIISVGQVHRGIVDCIDPDVGNVTARYRVAADRLVQVAAGVRRVNAPLLTAANVVVGDGARSESS